MEMFWFRVVFSFRVKTYILIIAPGDGLEDDALCSQVFWEIVIEKYTADGRTDNSFIYSFNRSTCGSCDFEKYTKHYAVAPLNLKGCNLIRV